MYLFKFVAAVAQCRKSCSINQELLQIVIAFLAMHCCVWHSNAEKSTAIENLKNFSVLVYNKMEHQHFFPFPLNVKMSLQVE